MIATFKQHFDSDIVSYSTSCSFLICPLFWFILIQVFGLLQTSSLYWYILPYMCVRTFVPVYTYIDQGFQQWYRFPYFFFSTLRRVEGTRQWRGVIAIQIQLLSYIDIASIHIQDALQCLHFLFRAFHVVYMHRYFHLYQVDMTYHIV